MARRAAPPAVRSGGGRSPRRGRSRRRLTFWVLVLVLLVAIVRVVAVQAYLVPSRAMENSLLAGDYILVETISCGARIPFTDWRLPALGRVRSGDVLVFATPNAPDRQYAKRCVALPGQMVEVRDKVLYVDGARRSEPPSVKHVDRRVLPASQSPRDNLSARSVPANSLFVVGDNRDDSRDSRHWGLLPERNVVGTAFVVYWSCQPDAGTGSGWQALFSRLRSLPERIRWGRVGHRVG